MRAHIEDGKMFVNAHPDELTKLRATIDEALASREAHNAKMAAEAPHIKLDPSGDVVGLCLGEVEAP